MKRLSEIKSELAKARKELEYIEGQLFNEEILATEGLSDLKPKEIAQLMARNEKLLTQCIQLEVTLEELDS